MVVEVDYHSKYKILCTKLMRGWSHCNLKVKEAEDHKVGFKQWADFNMHFGWLNVYSSFYLKIYIAIFLTIFR